MSSESNVIEAGQKSEAPDQLPTEPQAVKLSSSERARQREITSYLTAASVSSATPRLLTDVSPPPARSLDPTLTALVQLGASRLDCDRSFLSLIDGNTQYIVAEATKNTPLFDDDSPQEERDLYLGVIMMDKAWGVCPNTMNIFTDESQSLTVEEKNITADCTKYMIRDFHVDDHFKDRPYVKDWPYMRSYAEVPIISPLGYVIGGYCVIDNRPRDFDDNTIRVLTEIGRTIMAHLENTRKSHNQLRSERLIRGLDTFLKEEASLQKSRKNSAASNTSKSSHSSANNEIVRARTPTSLVGLPRSDSASDLPILAGVTGIVTNPKLNPGSRSQSVVTFAEEPPIQIDDVPSLPLRDPGLPHDMKRAFTRSASLIREALGLDGLVFLDACAVGFGSRQRFPRPLDDDPIFYDSEDEEDILVSDEVSPIIAVSVSQQSSKGSQTPSFPENLLHRIIRRYPRGQLFTADEYGVLSKKKAFSMGLDGRPPPFDRHISENAQTDVEDMFKVFPQARSTLFLPMWHFQKERWFAAAFGWTRDATHSFDDRDTAYLSAFGNSIMAEVSKYEALATSKAKSDFISSVSHEIRSPLHGILATTELLGDVLKNVEERSMLSMIQSCGTTLLDTMNHLLDFAKINNLASRSKGNSTAEQSTSVPTSLSQLVEEVTETVVAGHAYEANAHGSDPTGVNLASNLANGEDARDLPVLITFDIEYRNSWRLQVDVGAWKRIVMNLVGNALKYTPSGQISIRLSVNNHDDQDNICFAVQDTGIGMSEEYLKYRLFTPFAQENALAAGTGLGLCIVQQIVQNLGGRLDVRSELGIGTLVTAVVPVRESSFIEPKTDTRLGDLQGRKLCILVPPFNEPEFFSHESSQPENMKEHAIGVSIANIASTWLAMEVHTVEDTHQADADVYIATYPGDVGSVTSPILALDFKRLRPHGESPNHNTIRPPIGPQRLLSLLHNALTSPLPTPPTTNIVLPPLINKLTSIPTSPLTPPKEPETEILAVRPQLSSSLFLHPSTPPPQHHVLIVDDNAINLKILSQLVRQLGCSFATAINGLEAVQQYQAGSSTQPFSVVFMDVSMPIMDGFAATQAIRGYESEQNMQPARIIALTGLGNAANEKEAFTSGMDLFLTKPVSLQKVKALLLAEEEAS